MATPKLEAEYKRLYPGESNPQDIYLPPDMPEPGPKLKGWIIGVYVVYGLLIVAIYCYCRYV